MARKYLPTLSLDGWLESGTVIMERLFFHWLTTNATQSTFYLKDLESATHVLLKSEKVEETRNDIIASLTNMYQYYFTELDVKVDYKESKRGEVDYAIDVKGNYDNNGKIEACELSKIVPVGDKRLLDLPSVIDLVTFYRSVKTKINSEE